ncbi:ring-cleaving dioxygenase [Sinorhizobium medicae]|uniref:VOC family protein n=1 Tax=Sinorhizobium medicae TaxID=110321 RepID=UPI00036CEF32|nr:VOC family protein [Sinorhizobium medicae]MBO1943394.1 VOC family protein [Sinorhizobium medicae]MDX0428217.1 ring-cleaving dioxygenase [Sinorhizobium medicae]MDX0442214.1 ring-cleaving dioxygenase [Sinorhizobium medicae]MDX0459691.1 ring-cleaving dioxygenase [Sinorhizobium medicae]MDX0483584.1 ring-cleaving dioxygenase [Sinorhizobium medicae]
MTSGIHHITLIARKVQANVDFYVGFLGLHLVKRTGGYEDPNQLHLFYGDASGSPGSLVSFLIWEDGSPGRVGHGQPSEIAFAIPPESIGYWMTRALQFHIQATGPAQEFGEPVLRLKDPDGVIVKLVGTNALAEPAPWAGRDIPETDAIRRLRGATVLTEKSEDTARFLQNHFGYAETGATESIRRLTSRSGDVIDVRDAGGFWSAAPGTGTIDHIAFRAPDEATVLAVRADLEQEQAGATNAHDRKYFFSLYVREPGGSLCELATDGPGFTVDEAPDALGTTLFLPPHLAGDLTATLVRLPKFAMPGEPRVPQRDLPFIHRFYRPEKANDRTFVLLHGSGGNEIDMLPFGHQLDPRATLLGVRGRSTEEGFPRWFRRFSMTKFDQQDIRAEAEAFVAFVAGTREGYGLDLEKTVFIGYSNGANLLAAVLLLHPGSIRNVVLMRAMAALDDTPEPDLTGTKVLMLTGKDDPYGKHAPELKSALGDSGANFEAIDLDIGHGIGVEDIAVIRPWLTESGL